MPLPFVDAQIDKINLILLFHKLRPLAPPLRFIDATDEPSYLKSELIYLNRLVLLERFFTTRLAACTPVIVRLIPRSRYRQLNSRLCSHILCMPIRGPAKNDLVRLTFRMYERGCGLVGDIVQMNSAAIVAHAITVPQLRDPMKTAAQLEKALMSLDLGFDMRAPGWERAPGPSLEHLIEKRDATWKQQKTAAGRRLAQIRLVRPSDP